MTSTNNTNNTNSSTNRQRNNNNVKKDGIQKISNEKALAEAILIGRKPRLAIVDFSDLNNVRFPIMESLAYDKDTRLVPELLSNRPYSFKNKEEFDSFIERAKNESLDSLFDRVLSIWNKYIDGDEFHLKLCAADTIYTYFQDRLGMTHYLFFVADNDAGKSNNLTLFNILGYRNLMTTTMTHANVYNFLGSREEGVGTICIDEIDNIEEYPEMMSILKSGYTKGFPVVRIIDSVHGRRQVKFFTYCFKAMAGERLPDELEARGYMQRTIVIKCLPGFPKHDISEVTDPAGAGEYQDLLDELNEVRKLLFCYRLVHFKDAIPNIKLNIHNREKQLFKPLLRLFQRTQTFDILKPVISKYIRERRMAKANSYHAFLYRMVRDLIDSNHGSMELESSNIMNFFKANVDWKEIPFKPQSIETVEFGVVSQKRLIQTLKEVFHAEPPRRNGSNRRLVFKQNVLDRMKDTYEMDIEIQVDFETKETMEDYLLSQSQNGTHGTHGTLYEDIDSQSAPDKSEDTENSENDKEISENLEQSEIKRNNNNEKDSEAGLDPLRSYNVSQASQASQTHPRPYSDLLVNRVPKWELEKRGMTEEEAQAFRKEVEQLNKENNENNL
jgi:hypothetical protein